MNKGQDKKVYYKMYKKGRFWVFAGMTLAMLNVNTVVSHADEATDSSASDTESTSTTSVASQLTDQKVVLSSSNQASTDTDSATSTNNSAATDTTKADTTSQEASSATGDTSASATDSSATSDSSEKTSDSSTGDTSNANTSGTTTEATKAATTSSTTDQTSETTDNNSSTTDTTKTDTKASGTTDSVTAETTNTNNSNEVKVANDNLTDSLDTMTTPATDTDATNTDTNTTGDNTATNNGTTTTPATDNSAVDNVTTPETTGDTVAVAENEQLTDDLVTVQDAQAKVQDAVVAAAATTLKSRAGLMRAAAADTIITGTDGWASWSLDQDTGVMTILSGSKIVTRGASLWAGRIYNDQYYTDSIKTIVIEPNVTTGNYFNMAFANLPNLTSIEGLQNINTSNATDMGGLFQSDPKLTSVDASGWDTSHVTNMSFMFYGDFGTTVKTSINVSGFDTSAVTNMSSMFTNNIQLTTIEGLDGFDTSKVTNMSDMFANTGLSKLDLTNFNSISLVDTVNDSGTNGASGMFSGMTQLKTITFGPDFTLSNTAQFQDLFSGDSQLEELDLSHINMQLAIPDPAYVAPSDPGWLDYMSTYPRNSNMLSGTTSLKKLTLGPNNNLAVIGIASSNASLPEITKTDDYTGYWVDENDKSGKTYTSADLMALYSDPAADVPLVTYVWQVADKTTIKTTPVSIYAGGSWNWSQSITTLTDSDGNTVDVAALYAATPEAVTVTNTDASNPLDLEKAGIYNVTFTYNGKTETAQSRYWLIKTP